MIKTATIQGQSGTAYTVFDFPILTWKQYPVKGIYFLTKGNREHYHELVAIGESDNISQSIKSKHLVEKAHCLYILFVMDHYKRNEILKDIENSIPSAKRKSIHFIPREVKRN
jgi:hypothetical protein